jgi:predicted O-methyltransferase YrrM
MSFPPGHYYSPVPSPEDILKNQDRIFKEHPAPFIDYNAAEQHRLLVEFQSYYKDMPFTISKDPRCRYYLNNDSYPNTDGTILHFMIRHTKPRRIIEVGSGYSSMVMMDTNDFFFDGKIDLTFIEPHPESFKGLLRTTDKPNLIVRNVQDVDTGIFKQLESGDILFIDSSHVSKVDSDVNHLLFNVLPYLSPGVIVHFHDIFDGWEYPRQWLVNNGWYWNEMYLVKAFLSFNSAFKMLYFNSFMTRKYRSLFNSTMPLCVEPMCVIGTGGSLYIQKIS